jgi:serine protease
LDGYQYDHPTSGTIELSFNFIPAPPNDDFANRTVLNGSNISTNGNNSAASWEDGEPYDTYYYDDYGYKSVWFSWTATSPGLYTVSVSSGSVSYPILAVYTGTQLSTLSTVTDIVGDDRCAADTINAATGQTYQIEIDDNDGNGGNYSLRIAPTTILALDNSLNNLSETIGSQTLYKITIPAGLTALQISISGGTGDCDLYVKFGSPPTLYSWDYYPGLDGNNEDVNISNPTAGDWYIMLNGYNNYSGVTLLAQ